MPDHPWFEVAVYHGPSRHRAVVFGTHHRQAAFEFRSAFIAGAVWAGKDRDALEVEVEEVTRPDAAFIK